VAKRKSSKKTDTAAEPSLSDQERAAMLETVRKNINKEFGEGTLVNLDCSQAGDLHPYQIPTGSLGLDIAIGPLRRTPEGLWMTGIPPAKMIEIFGDESTGKTTLALHLIARAQRLFKGLKLPLSTAYVDVEHAVDKSYAQNLGVRTGEMEFTQPQSGDQALKVVDRLLSSRLFGMIVVDSVAALAPESELDGEVTDTHVGTQARMMSQSLRDYCGKLGPDNPTVLVFINQIREKINRYGGGRTTPGGRALRFYSNLRFDVRRGESIAADAAGAPPAGHDMIVNIIKNKVAAPFRTATIPLYYGYGIERLLELARLCVQWGIIEQSGAWYACPDLGLRTQGLANLVAEMRERVGQVAAPLRDRLLTAVLASRGLTPDCQLLPDYVPPVDHSVEDQMDQPGLQEVI